MQAPAPAVGGRVAETPVDRLSKQLDRAAQDAAPQRERYEEAARREATTEAPRQAADESAQRQAGRDAQMRSAAKEERATQEQGLFARKDAPAPQPFPASPAPPPRASAPTFAAPPSPAAGAPAAAAPPAARNPSAQNAQSAASTITGQRGAAADARAKVATTRPADDFIREIERLRSEGRDADAALALAAFRAAYADADERLPNDLRGWARGVPRP